MCDGKQTIKLHLPSTASLIYKIFFSEIYFVAIVYHIIHYLPSHVMLVFKIDSHFKLFNCFYNLKRFH